MIGSLLVKARCLFLLFVLSHCSGCTGSFQTVPGDTNIAHSPACQKIDSKRRVAGTITATAIAAGVAASAASALLQKDHPNTALSFAVGGVGTGAIAGGATWYETDAAATYREMCTEGRTTK